MKRRERAIKTPPAFFLGYQLSYNFSYLLLIQGLDAMLLSMDMLGIKITIKGSLYSRAFSLRNIFQGDKFTPLSIVKFIPILESLRIFPLTDYCEIKTLKESMCNKYHVGEEQGLLVLSVTILGVILFV